MAVYVKLVGQSLGQVVQGFRIARFFEGLRGSLLCQVVVPSLVLLLVSEERE